MIFATNKLLTFVASDLSQLIWLGWKWPHSRLTVSLSDRAREGTVMVEGAEMADLQEALRKLLSEHFREVRILSVLVEDSRFCEDGVIEITVEFEGSTEELVRGQPAGLFGMVRNTVADFCIQGAPDPVFNFIAAEARA